MKYTDEQIAELRTLLENVSDTYFDFVEGQITASKHDGTVEQLIKYLKENPDSDSSEIARLFT